MFKKLLFVFIITGYSIISYGQMYIGLSGGATFTKFSNPHPQNYSYIYSYEKYAGISINIPVLYQLNKHVSFQSGLSYSNIGSSYSYTLMGVDPNDPIYQSLNDEYMVNNVLQYISLPLTVKYTIPVKKFGFYGRAGGYMSYAFDGYSIAYSNGEKVNKSKTVFSKNGPQRFDAGLIVGVGIQFELGKGYLFAEAMYLYGMHKVSKSSSRSFYNSYNRGILLNVGYMISLRKNDQ